MARMSKEQARIAKVKTIVAHTPLLAVDLLVHDGRRLLMGMRVNRPARGWYFVPGDPIRHNEAIAKAFKFG